MGIRHGRLHPRMGGLGPLRPLALAPPSKGAQAGEGGIMNKPTRGQVLKASALILIGGLLAYVLWGGLEQNLVYFVTPSELLEKGDQAVGNPVRLGGVVAAGTVRLDSNILSFEL